MSKVAPLRADSPDPVVPAIDALDRMAVALVAATNAAIVEGALGVETTFTQWRMIVVVDPSLGGLRPSDVADRVGISRPSASRLLKRLAERGLVAITRDPVDGRGVRVALTRDGEAFRTAVLDHRHRLIAEAMAGVVLTPAEERGLELAATALGTRPW